MFSVKLHQAFYQYFSITTLHRIHHQSFGNNALSANLELRSWLRGEQTLVDNHTFKEGDAFKEASFTSPALSPKMARSNFLRRRIRFTFRSNLTNQNITRLDASTHEQYRFRQIFGSFFTYIRNIRSQLFHTTLRFTNSKEYSSTWMKSKVLTNHTFVQHDSILHSYNPSTACKQPTGSYPKQAHPFRWITFRQGFAPSSRADLSQIGRRSIVMFCWYDAISEYGILSMPVRNLRTLRLPYDRTEYG